MDLAVIESKSELIQPIAAANPQLSPPAVDAIASTALTVAELQSGPYSTFIPAKLLLLPPLGTSNLPSQDIQNYLHQLVISAESAAASISCSSILAGAGSESDDTGDVALWLGPGDFGNAQSVLRALGLAEWANAGEIMIAQIADVEFSLPPDSTLGDQLGSLKGIYCFRVRAAITGSIVLFFLIGQSASGWGGLVGVGTWS